MSDIFGHLDISRKGATVLFAVAAVAMMLAVPFLSVIDSDAEAIKKDEAGYSIKMDNPTDDELEQFHTQKEYLVKTTMECFLLNYFDTSLFDPSLDPGSLSIVQTTGRGVKFTSDSELETIVQDVRADNVNCTFTADDDGDLISHIPDGDMKAVAEAIETYFGSTVAEGDRLIFSGKMGYALAARFNWDYAQVDDDHSVIKKAHFTMFTVTDFDLTITYVKAGQDDGKRITLKSNIKFASDQDWLYDYGKDYSQIKPGDTFTFTEKEGAISLVTGNAKFSIDGREYPCKPFGGEERKSTEEVEIFDNSDLNCDNVRREIQGLPGSTANISVGKEYGDIESAFDLIALEVAGKKVLTFVLIGILALVVIVALIVYLVIRRRR